MSWWTGKANLVGIAFGDSNVVGVGGFQLGVQTFNTALRCYATTDAEPYDPSELEWRTLDPNGTSRYDQMQESLVVQDTTYIGQVLGGNGAPAMQMASVIQQQTGCDNFWLYQGAKGGSTSVDWSSGSTWATMQTYFPAALAAVPGSPTYADVIYFSCGAADHIFDARSAEDYYTNMLLLRSNMIDAGWWVPGTTQIIIQDTPRLPIMGTWDGVQLVRSRFRDRIGYADSVGATFLDEGFFTVHYTPASMTAMGENGGNQMFEQLPWQRSVFSVGGNRLSVGGDKLRVHSA